MNETWTELTLQLSIQTTLETCINNYSAVPSLITDLQFVYSVNSYGCYDLVPASAQWTTFTWTISING